jgi:hypothetical protein
MSRPGTFASADQARFVPARRAENPVPAVEKPLFGRGPVERDQSVFAPVTPGIRPSGVCLVTVLKANPLARIDGVSNVLADQQQKKTKEAIIAALQKGEWK